MTSASASTIGVVMVAFAVFAKVSAQTVLKSRLTIHGVIPFSFLALVGYLKLVLADLQMLFGGVLLVLAAGLWFFGLSRLPLSIAFPMGAIAYPLVLFASVAFLRERMTARLVWGNAFIFFGILVLGVEI